MRHRATTKSAQDWIESFKATPAIDDLGAIAARFIYSLRLIAVHERVRRDPVPELAVRLGDVAVASRSLSLAQSVSATWPENVHVSRFCCRLLTHDEATIGSMIDAAGRASHAAFRSELAGLIRPERIHTLWDQTLALIVAETNAR